MFLPSEGIYHAALAGKPDLIEQAWPTKCLSLRHDADRAVASGPLRLAARRNWQKTPSGSAIRGRVLHERLATLFESLRKARCGPGRGPQILQTRRWARSSAWSTGGAQAGGTGRGGQEASGRKSILWECGRASWRRVMSVTSQCEETPLETNFTCLEL